MKCYTYMHMHTHRENILGRGHTHAHASAHVLILGQLLGGDLGTDYIRVSVDALSVT